MTGTPICGACNRLWTVCKADPCVSARTISGVVYDEEDGRVCAVIYQRPAAPRDASTPTSDRPASTLLQSALFRRPDSVPPRRTLYVTRFDPGTHYYLRHHDVLGGERATDEKYDTVAEAKEAADQLGYDLAPRCYVVGLGGTRWEKLGA